MTLGFERSEIYTYVELAVKKVAAPTLTDTEIALFSASEAVGQE